MLLETVTSDVCNAVTEVIEGGESLFFLSFNILYWFNVFKYIVVGVYPLSNIITRHLCSLEISATSYNI